MRWNFCFAALWAMPGCSCGDDDDQDVTRVEREIGADGGSIQSSDGVVTLLIPAGALGETITFFIDASTEAGPQGLLGIPYEIGPGGTRFARPATLVIGYHGSALDDRPPQALRIGSYAGIAWSCQPYVTADTDSEVVVASIDHLSSWALLFNECTRSQDCSAFHAGSGHGEQCLGSGVCALPCAGEFDCPSPMVCDPSGSNVCIWQLCHGGDECADPDNQGCTAADDTTKGVCSFSCEGIAQDDLCGAPVGQLGCTAGGECFFRDDELCAVEADCDVYEDGVEKICLHGWCVPATSGCVCGEGCDCGGGGGDGDADADADTDADSDGDCNTDTPPEDPLPYCAVACSADDDCCGGTPGCSERGNAHWDCRAGHCHFRGCLSDTECAFFGPEALCFQINLGSGVCSFACTPEDDGICVENGQECISDDAAIARGLQAEGTMFCGYAYACAEEDCQARGQTCGEQPTGESYCVCDPDQGPQACDQDADGSDCVVWECERVPLDQLGCFAPGGPCEGDRDCPGGSFCCVFEEECDPADRCTCVPE